MNILIANDCKIPVYAYGGTERVIWDLGKKLTEIGHNVSFLVSKGSRCDFANVYEFNEKLPIASQIPKNIDVVHFQFNPKDDFDFPYIVTEHSNHDLKHSMSKNTVFLTKNHAQRHGSNQFVHNGLDWKSYGNVSFAKKINSYHFLGKAARPDKNINGAIAVAKKAGVKLDVLGGHRLSVSRKLRFTLSTAARFHGMVGGSRKFDLLNQSSGLIFPVTWHEPFGLAITESLYFGCPVFGTPYGSLPELTPEGCGHLSSSSDELADAIKHRTFDPRFCHHIALSLFGSDKMASSYLEKYQMVLDGQVLNQELPYLRSKRNNLDWS
jgi:glycosyltransferase involved in cell wall biosynthesis